jgi:hypothetical protein
LYVLSEAFQKDESDLCLSLLAEGTAFAGEVLFPLVLAWNEHPVHSYLMVAMEELCCQTDLHGTHEGSWLLSWKDGEAQGVVQNGILPYY